MKLRPAGTQIVAPGAIPVSGKCPYTFADDAQFLVSRAMIDDLQKNGPKWKYYDAHLLMEALENPSAIFSGLRRTNFQDGFCYSLLPELRWHDDQTKVAPPPIKVFAVHVHPKDDGLHVLDWEWRIANPKEPDVPNRWRIHFTRKIWPTS